MSNITIIAAMDKNNVIGSKGTIPWHCPTDLRWFKSYTLGKTVVMGSKTFKSLKKPLPHRTNVVVTRNIYTLLPKGVVRSSTVESAIALASSYSEDVVVIGGGKVYQKALPYVDEMFITLMSGEWKGDTYFPSIDPTVWEVNVIDEVTCPESNLPFTLLRLTRKTV